ncbi:MAG: autotransporter-associated beta strand repeat-containing protein [Verrucomicrobiota bacterium]
MKSHRPFLSIGIAVSLIAPAVGDTIYSNLLDTPISTDFTGVTLNIAGGSINPFFGGVAVANNNLLQPVRSSTGNLAAIANLSAGSVIDASAMFATGFGGSQTHLGTTFTAGQEGNIGFQLNGSNYGWLRVVFTNNTGGAVIKDWAYDNSGQPVVVGRVHQGAVATGTQLVTLSPGSGESFVLGSALANTGGNVNSLIKAGAGTVTLSQVSTYTGNTTVNAGTLIVAANSATTFADTSTVSIAATALLNLPNPDTDTIASLVINGSALPDGIYGASSPATSGYLTGAGKLQVGTGGFDGWAALNAGGQTASEDFDLDGVANGVEFFMGTTGTAFTASPSVVTVGAVSSITWPNGGNIASSAYGTRFVVQTSADLTTWTDVLAGDANLSNTSGAVRYTLPSGPDSVFVRLSVTPN